MQKEEDSPAMVVMGKWVRCLAMAIWVSGCAHYSHQREELMAKSVNLRQGMPAEQVLALFGKPPDQTEAGTCGQSMGQPSQCVTWTYEAGSPDRLRITFQTASNGTLVVTDWNW
jgi:hypothetical protein